MQGPIYKMYMMKYTAEWFRMPPEERAQCLQEVTNSIQKVGGEHVMAMISAWSSEKWMTFGVDKYPNLEAAQNHVLLLYQMGWFQYIESESYLGTEIPAGMQP